MWRHYMDAIEKKFEGNNTRMLRTILNAAPHKAAAVRSLQPIRKTIKIRRTRHAEHCWRIKDELINVVLLLTSSHGWAKAGRLARTYSQQLCADTGCSSEYLPEALDDRGGWRERVRGIRADGATWWGRWWSFYQRVEQIPIFTL